MIRTRSGCVVQAFEVMFKRVLKVLAKGELRLMGKTKLWTGCLIQQID